RVQRHPNRLPAGYLPARVHVRLHPDLRATSGSRHAGQGHPVSQQGRVGRNVRGRGVADVLIRGEPEAESGAGRNSPLCLQPAADSALGLGDQVPGVQSAFLLRGLFPPPAASALVLVRQDGAGARLAADPDEAPLMQAVVGDFEHTDVGPDFLAAHLRQRVELVQVAFGRGEGAVDFQHGDLAACARALVTALAGGPGAYVGQLAAQRLDLADAAALAMPVAVEAEQALFVDHRLQQFRVRGHDLDRNVVVIADLLDETIGFAVQAAGVEAEHLDALVQLPGHVHQHDVFR